MGPEVEERAMHDVQRFLVGHLMEWSINTDGEVDVLVQRQNHDEDIQT